MIDWIAFIPAAVAVSLIPGANQLLGLRNAVRHGTAWALAGIGGRLAAFTVLIGLVVAGLGTILMASADALEVIKWVGVLYLLWIGIAGLRSAWQTWKAPAGSNPPMVADSEDLRRVVVNEFVVAISNPKALLLFAALLPQFTDAGQGAANEQIALLGIAYLGIELLVGLVYIGLGSRIGAGGLSRRTRIRVDVGSGACFLGLGGLLAADDVT